MSKKHTGLMLSEARGPLNNLFDNLSGEKGAYWLDALKKLLRKEKLPELPTNVLAFTKTLNSKEDAKQKLEEWVSLFNAIPSVYRARVCDEDDEIYLIDIEVSSNLACFIHGNENEDKALFSFGIYGSVDRTGASGEITDVTFNKWCKNEYKDLYTFYKALLNLSEMYQKVVPTPLVK